MKKKTIKRVRLSTTESKDDLRSHYDVDYSQTMPNRFAKRKQIVIGATTNPESAIAKHRGGARNGAGRKPSPEPLVSKHVYLTARHIKILQRLDKNLSAAIRKLTDASQNSLR
ncbi:MAG TPA: hypothetical protein VFD70_23135 [Anaerolineae bacterium]|nr:hypothetical protein [Anaerolineae bacterium]